MAAASEDERWSMRDAATTTHECIARLFTKQWLATETRAELELGTCVSAFITFLVDSSYIIIARAMNNVETN